LTQSVAYIGLGSNLGDRVGYLRAAIDAVKHFGDPIAISTVYESDPHGVDEDQPLYLNMVLAISTRFEPKVLLGKLLEIERANGRVRDRANESRTLDLDILMMDSMVLHDPDLVIPHPRMHEREFVMIPLTEIAPRILHPTLNRTIADIASGLADQGVRRLGKISQLTSEVRH